MQRQPPERFCKKAVLKNLQYSQENIRLADSLWFRILRIFQGNYFEEHPQTAASENAHKTEKS